MVEKIFDCLLHPQKNFGAFGTQFPTSEIADRSMMVRPNQGERSEGVGGTFGRLTLLNTATYQELLYCNRSKAPIFKRSGNEWVWGFWGAAGSEPAPPPERSLECGLPSNCGDNLKTARDIPRRAVCCTIQSRDGYNCPPPPPAAPPPDDEMTITKSRPTKVQCSHSPGCLLSERQDEALDVGHCCNRKNNVKSVLQVLFDAFSQNAFHFSLILSHLMNWGTGCC